MPGRETTMRFPAQGEPGNVVSFLFPNANIEAEDTGHMSRDTHLMPGIRVIPFAVSIHKFADSFGG